MGIHRPKKLDKPIKLPKTIKTDDLSDHSKDILTHFGLEAPSLLNTYCCALEDALIEQVTNKQTYLNEIKRLKALLSEYEIN